MKKISKKESELLFKENTNKYKAILLVVILLVVCGDHTVDELNEHMENERYYVMFGNFTRGYAKRKIYYDGELINAGVYNFTHQSDAETCYNRIKNRIPKYCYIIPVQCDSNNSEFKIKDIPPNQTTIL